LDVLIIDDDPIASRLTETLLSGTGLKTFVLKKISDTLVTIKKKKPKAIILDLMLSNLNGLELIKLIKSDASNKKIKIIVVTQKAYDFEKKKAFQYGASNFIKKPYDVETFAHQIKHIIEEEKIPELEEQIKVAKQKSEPEKPNTISSVEDGHVRITLWGYRGMPSKISDTTSYMGRQTPCVAIETKNDLVILDAGSGIISLGEQIVNNNGPKNIWILLTHFHMDHIWGLAHFAPIYQKGYTIKISGPGQIDKNFKELMSDIFYGSPYWESKVPKAQLLMYEMGMSTYDIGEDIKVTPMQANHPSNTLCYRLEAFNKKIVYAPDSEISGETKAIENYEEKLKLFCQNADVLIHDSAYTHNDYLLNTNTGHSSDENVVEFAALKAKVKHLLMFHISGDYDDEILEKMINTARQNIAENNWALICHKIKEEFTLTI